MKILLVEDEEIIAQVHRLYLEMGGNEVVAVTDTAEEACVLASELHPDLIVMDVRLNGEMDGIEGAAEIQRTNHIPVVYVSGNSDKPTVERSKNTLCAGFLVKPVLAEELNEVINNVKNRRGV